jgi:hypothetical protein
MEQTIAMAQTALKYEVEVREQGRVEFTVPFAPGKRVTIFVVEEPDDNFRDRLEAFQSTLDFWDNPLDDEDWNDA